jgi:hypothetical protein
MVQREPMDLAGYVRRSTRGPCFVCATVSGDPDYKHEIVYEDEAHIAFLSRYPTQLGYLLVAPKVHIARQLPPALARRAFAARRALRAAAIPRADGGERRHPVVPGPGGRAGGLTDQTAPTQVLHRGQSAI